MHKMKYLSGLLVTLLILLQIPGLNGCSDDSSSNDQPDTTALVQLKWLHTSGHQILDEDNQPLLLHGINRSGLEYDKNGNSMYQGEFNYIVSAWDCDVIRVPFNQEWVMQDVNYVNTIDQVIDWIKTQGAYVILDLQWQNSVSKIPRIPDTSAITMWKLLADRYKNEPAVLYDIHNEAHDIGLTEWKARAIEIIDAIQTIHPQALILVSGLNWAADLSQWSTDLIDRPNIVYTIHLYPSSSQKGNWGQRFGNYANQIPIFCGELGGEAQDLVWGKELITYLNQKNIGWCAWSWTDWPKLTESDLRTPTAFGAMIRTALQRYTVMDSTPITINQPQILYISSLKATITWTTPLETNSIVYYGKTFTYTDSVSAPIMIANHVIKLSGLIPNTIYHLKIRSADEFGFSTETSDTTFTTLP